MILVHGGVGPGAPDRMERVRQGLRAAAAAGNALLERGGGALDDFGPNEAIGFPL